MLDSLVDYSLVPNKNEIKNYSKKKIVQTPELVDQLHKLDNKLLHDSEIWIQGYAEGVATDTDFKRPLDEKEVTEFYLERVFEFIATKLID